MKQKNKDNYRRVRQVEKKSIAAALGIRPGDCLLSIDGRDVLDVFDYRMRLAVETVTLCFGREDGSYLEVLIEKEETDDLGLIFEEPMMDTPKRCHNACVFCFIDQLPKGLRDSLYFKDDDVRLCFLSGNYVTLSNLTKRQLERFLTYRMSPMNVSVHATDPSVRSAMLRNEKAGDILPVLRRIAQAGIDLNCQIVLCPGINDGTVLDQTLRDLEKIGERVRSIAIVPVGLTRFRDENKCPQLRFVDRKAAITVLDQIDQYQRLFLEKRGKRVVFAADEWYLLANRDTMPLYAYEDLYQIENGVGMQAAHRAAMLKGLDDRKGRARPIKRRHVTLICGLAAKEHLESFTDKLAMLYHIDLKVMAVSNRFFGPHITVSGLLTATDIIFSFAASKTATDLVIVPDTTLRYREDLFLDDKTVSDLSSAIGYPVRVAKAEGEGLLETLDQWVKEEEKER